MNALEIKNLSKTYPGFCIDNISFSLPSGCIMGLIGENGAGKSTTIKLIMDTISRDQGEIFVLGKNNKKNFNAVKEDIGIVLDEAYFPESITPKQVNSIMKRTYKRWDEKYFFDLLNTFSLPLKKVFKDFSRGMKMKLAIAVALSHKPKLLILDEATSGLDPIVRDEILELFNDFTRDENHSILISSHIVSDLEKLCDYIAFLHKGKLIFCEEKDRLLEKYGVIRCGKAQYSTIPQDAILGSVSSDYGVEALVERDKLPYGFDIEQTSIENIIIFLAKEAKQQ